MLAFLVNNIPLALDASASVRIAWSNPACFFDSIPGDVAMGIDIPVNEVNRMLLGNPGRFEKLNDSSSREITGFEIRFGGVLLLAGTLVIQSANAETYAGWCRSNVGNMGREHREKYIYDIAAFNENKTFVNKPNYDPDTDQYGCPEIYNPDFFRDKGRKKDNYSRLVNNPNWYAGSGEDQFITEFYEEEMITHGFKNYAFARVNRRNTDYTVKLGAFQLGGIEMIDELPVTVVSPMLFLNHVIETLLRDAGFYMGTNAIADNADLKKLVIYNNFDITSMGFYSTHVLKEIIPMYDGEMVQSYATKIESFYRNYQEKFRYRDLLPKVKLKDFIIGVQNLLNVCFHFLRNGKVNIIDREAIITATAIDIDTYLVGEWEKGEKIDTTLKFEFRHDNNDSMFRERWEDIDDRRADEKEPVATVAALDLIAAPSIGEVRFVQSLNVYMQYAWTQRVTGTDPDTENEITDDYLGWTYLAGNFQNGYFNRGTEDEEQITTPFSTLANNIIGQLPEVQQPGNIKSIKFAYQNFSPRLLFYTGNNSGSFETANIALDWEKTGNGLLATRWPKWSRFWCQRQPVSRGADLPINMLDFITRNITSKFRSREGEFIIETIETEFRLNSIGTSKITGYKNDYIPKAKTLTEHWAPENMVIMDELIDFTGFDNMNFDMV